MAVPSAGTFPGSAPTVGAGDPPGVLDYVKRAFGGGAKPPAGGAGPKDPYSDQEAMLEYFKGCKEECFENRWIYERIWWRNILYVLGRQWIYYDVNRNQWQDKRLAKWIPRPVTNKMADTVQAIRSIFAGVELAAIARPTGDSADDMATAEVADAYLVPILEEHGIKLRMEEADFWFVVCGNVFLHPRWDKHGEGAGITTVPLEQCQSCGKVYGPTEIVDNNNTCPGCGSPAFVNATDEQGRPLYQSFSNGRGVTDVLSPFEVAGPVGYARAEDWPFLIRIRWRPKHWWTKNYPDLAKTLNFDKMPQDRSLQLLKAIPSASEIGTQPMSREGGPDGHLIEGLTEYELWAKPSKQYPKGLFLRVVGEKGQEQIVPLPDEVVAGPLPYVTAKGEPIWNWIHMAYEQIGGRVWGRSPLDACITKQDQLNQLDSLTILIVNRVANPVWLEPRGAEVKKFTGEPGLVVKWNPLVGQNAKPERIEGQNIPSSLFQMRAQHLEDIEALSGTYDVIKGAKPTGVEAFSALQLLVERSQSRFTQPLQERGEGFRKFCKIALELERKYGPEERLQSAMGANNRWTFQRFQRADLSGAIDVIIEDGSQAPKTSLGDRAAIEQLKNFGMINAADPEQTYEILKRFGQTKLVPSLNVHVKTALREQAEWEQWAATVQQTPPQPVMGPAGAMAVDPTTGQPMMQPGISAPPPGQRKPWHNDQVHVVEHTKWLNSDIVTDLLKQKPWLEPYATMFLEQHQQAMMMQQMQQQQMQQPIDAGQAGGGGQAMSSSNRESGNPADVPHGNGQRADNMGPV